MNHDRQQTSSYNEQWATQTVAKIRIGISLDVLFAGNATP